MEPISLDPLDGVPPSELWSSLDRASRRRKAAEDRAAAASTECRALVVALLRSGVRPSDLYGRPFSPAYVSRIQRAEGLTRADRRAVKPAP